MCWCHIILCAKNLCNSKICITYSWLWRDVKLGSVRIVAVSTGRWRHGTPLWTTTEFTLFLLQYGLAFVSRESGILLPLAKVASNFKITYLLLYSKLGAKIADSSVSARLLFFHNLFFFWKFYFLSKNFTENFTCRVEQSKFVEKNWNLTFFETIDFPNKIIFLKKYFWFSWHFLKKIEGNLTFFEEIWYFLQKMSGKSKIFLQKK